MSKQFGWIPTLIRIAKTKLFDVSGKTSIEAAGDANVWEAFSILNYEEAQSQYQDRLRKEQNKK